ncbi:fatty acyl-CoA reductase 2, chloroplastic-like [Miscanthus floridulus]|uniref:fatty acyl-CoA reductase 2, chloroplastic-like n=1 Tax=Miscanthus floridulus TaxID=154761 RepID=UPI00345780A1
MAAMAKHGGGMAMVPGNCLYHLTSSTMNPMVAREMGRYMYQHFSQSPLIDKAGRPIIVQPPSAIGNMEEFVRYVQSNVVLPEGNGEDMSSPQQARSRLRAKAIAEQFIHISRIYEPYTFYGGRFDSANTEALFAAGDVSAGEGNVPL